MRNGYHNILIIMLMALLSAMLYSCREDDVIFIP